MKKKNPKKSEEGILGENISSTKSWKKHENALKFS